MPDFLALTGDTADGIPGLAGFGEKSAAAAARRLRAPRERSPTTRTNGRVKPRGGAAAGGDAGRRSASEALLYRKLATLVEDVPLAETLDDLRFRGVPRARFEAWCDELGVTTLKSTPKRWAE